MTNLPCASTDIIRPHQGLPSSNFYSEIQRIVVFPWGPPPAPFSTDFTERNSVQEKLQSWVEVLYWPLFKTCNQDTKEKRLHWKLSRGPILQLGHWFLAVSLGLLSTCLRVLYGFQTQTTERTSVSGLSTCPASVLLLSVTVSDSASPALILTQHCNADTWFCHEILNTVLRHRQTFNILMVQKQTPETYNGMN